MLKIFGADNPRVVVRVGEDDLAPEGRTLLRKVADGIN